MKPVKAMHYSWLMYENGLVIYHTQDERDSTIHRAFMAARPVIMTLLALYARHEFPLWSPKPYICIASYV